MKHGDLSQKIRDRATQSFIRPAVEQGREQFSIKVKDLMNELEAEGFPRDHQAQFCSAVQTKNFLLEHGLEIERIEGPASKKSTTVVFHYRFKRRHHSGPINSNPQLPKPIAADPLETSAERAKRLTGKLRGLLKNELAEYGGAEGFIRWIRSDEEHQV
jgi:hypothetical protein